MSIANDVRSYADSAFGQAQARLTEARGDASEFAGKVLSGASVTYAELRTRGEALTKRAGALPAVERASATVEPYVAQLKVYGGAAADVLEQVYAELRKNEQIAKVIAAAETSFGAVQGRVMSLLDRQPTASAPAPAPATSPATSSAKPPAVAEPSAVAKPEPADQAPAKAPAKTNAAKATPAKRTTTRRATQA
jgi:hypothetical protein